MQNTHNRNRRPDTGRRQNPWQNRPHSGQSRGRPPQGGRPSRGRNRSTFDVSRYINRNPANPVQETPYAPTHAFKDFNLSPALLASIERHRLTTPTEIQDTTIPHILSGKDVVGLANTGTGKTAAFLIPLIELASRDPKREVLILVPTRELAIQVEQEFRKLSSGLPLYGTVCVGGAAIGPQIKNLKYKNHFVIATPGRALDLIARRAFRTDEISAVVLDEADRMLDMGFIHDMRKILSHVKKGHQVHFFSATMSEPVTRLIRDFSRDPVTVSVIKHGITNTIEQDVVSYHGKDKFSVLTELLEQPEFTRVLVFGAMKHSVERLARQLKAHGIAAESIHGNKSHRERQRALEHFKQSKTHVLVATDVAARGIHVDDISHVINYDLPKTYEDYVHRIGRTGRKQQLGKALTFVE